MAVTGDGEVVATDGPGAPAPTRFRRTTRHAAEARALLSEIRLTPLTAGVAIAAMVGRGGRPRHPLPGRPVRLPPVVVVDRRCRRHRLRPYVGYAISLGGAAGRAMPPLRTLQLEVAESVTTMATPESVGGLALTMRFLRVQGLETPQAAAACGLSAFVTTRGGAVIIPVAGIMAASTIDVSQLESDVPSGSGKWWWWSSWPEPPRMSCPSPADWARPRPS